jgi:hypothetical protein
MTIEAGSLPRRTAAQLRAFVRAQHVELERHPDDVAPESASSSTYWRYLVSRIPLEGVCVYYQTYDASGDENDWNLNIAPDPAHDWLLDPAILQALSLFSGAPSLMEACSVKCKEGYQVIEAELTPDNALYDKFVTGGLPISAGSWPPNKDENQGEGPTGDRVGVYGVYCGDYGHGGRPEIHPFDGLWRQRHRDGRAASISWDLGVFQDDSNRFNNNWSRPPIDVEFRIPFCVDVPVTLRSSVTTQAQFVLARSDLCSVVGGNTRAAGGSDLAETFTARTVRLNRGLENRVEVTVRDSTGLAGRPFALAFDDLTYTTSSPGLLRRRAWLAGRIVIRIAVEEDGFAYWNLRGPNSTTAADADSGDRVIDDRVVGRDVILPVVRDRVDAARTRRVRLVEATPKVSLGRSPSIAVDVRAESVAGDGSAEDRGLITVRPREAPWVLDEAIGRWTQLESFDFFAVASVERPLPGRDDPEPARRVQADISAAIGRLAGLERLGHRLRGPSATVEIDDTVTVNLRGRYAPYRDGEVMGEERSLLSERLNEIDTGEVTTQADVWITEAGGRTRRLRIGHGDEPDGQGAASLALDPSANGQRLVVGGLPEGLAVVRLEGSLEDRFGLRSDVSALAANFRVVGARPWVEATCGVSLDALRGRLSRVDRSVRLAPTAEWITIAGMLRALVEALVVLDAESVVSATRVAGAVRLTRRVQELIPQSAT